MQLVADNGDSSADGEDLQDAAETMGGGEDLVSADSGDDLLGYTAVHGANQAKSEAR